MKKLKRKEKGRRREGENEESVSKKYRGREGIF